MEGSFANLKSSCEGREGDAGWLCQLAIGEQAEYRRSRVDGQGATIEEIGSSVYHLQSVLELKTNLTRLQINS